MVGGLATSYGKCFNVGAFSTLPMLASIQYQILQALKDQTRTLVLAMHHLWVVFIASLTGER